MTSPVRPTCIFGWYVSGCASWMMRSAALRQLLAGALGEQAARRAADDDDDAPVVALEEAGGKRIEGVGVLAHALDDLLGRILVEEVDVQRVLLLAISARKRVAQRFEIARAARTATCARGRTAAPRARRRPRSRWCRAGSARSLAVSAPARRRLASRSGLSMAICRIDVPPMRFDSVLQLLDRRILRRQQLGDVGAQLEARGQRRAARA